MADTISATGPDRSRPRRRLLLLFCGVLCAAAIGGAAQFTIASARSVSAVADVTSAPEFRKELAIGRIVVNVRPASGNGDVSHLIIDPVIEYRANAADDDAPDEIQELSTRFRDSFIDYLSQVGVQEVSGSASLTNMRHELLRRARVVAGNDAPRAILIQEYILQ